MKKRLLTLIMMFALTMGLVACGSNDKTNDKTNTGLGNADVNVEDSKNDSSESLSTDSETVDTEEEKTPVISPVKEEEAVIDFDGVKLPLTITWEEFKQFMTDNGWTFEDDEDDFPGEKRGLTGNGFIKTNCGKVFFHFDENEDKTQSVLMYVTAYRVYCPATISISGINADTPLDMLSAVLTPVENSDTSFYLDEYLTVNSNDAAFTIDRVFFHMRDK